MNLKHYYLNVKSFFKVIYAVWFPWLDIAILLLIYLFLWGEHINPYHQYKLIKYGKIAIGQVSGEDGLYKNSDRPRMRDFIYTFTLPNGKLINSSSHTFSLDKETMKKKPIYPLKAEISYLPYQPEINWIKSDLPENLGDFFYRNLVFGTSFIAITYMIGMIICRLNILECREKKRIKNLAKKHRILAQMSKAQLN
ncbi:MAG: hypothetical protein EON51_02300 [Acinetobacter sp.]|nr:MAG: hypothetical protein EON51_02300 [Acinetobacter sp.]